SQGYWGCYLRGKDYKTGVSNEQTFRTHKIVLYTFNGNLPDDEEVYVDRVDNDEDNNHYMSLERVSTSDNSTHLSHQNQLNQRTSQ
ncbi:hypothetical protein MBANPS3_002533, partial [Mucor bainieri]